MTRESHPRGSEHLRGVSMADASRAMATVARAGITLPAAAASPWTEYWWLRQVPARLELHGRRLRLVRYEWCVTRQGVDERGTTATRRAANRQLAAARERLARHPMETRDPMEGR